VTTADAADALGVSVRTMERWVQRDLIRPDLRTPGGHYRWDVARLRAELAAWPERAAE
jgi:DNA-binding transcriptional MerR regulator